MLTKPQQIELFEEHELYHQPERFGYFSILSKDRDNIARQHSYILPQLPDVLRLLPRDRDSYLSQAEFIAPNRRIVNLARIGLLFVDLDCYKVEKTTWQDAESGVLVACDRRGIPHPSVIIRSGRGIYAKWILDGTIPRQALPRWNRVQAELVGMLEHLGADPGAKDASRVLRIVGTVNTKSGAVVQVSHITPGPDGQPVRYKFDQLAELILPTSRKTIETERKARQEAKEARQAAKLFLVKGNPNTSGLHRFSGRQLAWHRLDDLRTLAKLRGGVTEGWRMRWMFWSLNFLLLSGATHSGQMFHEARALAREIGFLDGWTEADLSTLYRKAQAFERGERIEFGGKEYPPLYTPRNQTLLDLFQITPDEERELRTIVSEEEAKKRDADRKAVDRAAAGAKSRATEDDRISARLMRAGGATLMQIAAELGVSYGTAWNWCEGIEP